MNCQWMSEVSQILMSKKPEGNGKVNHACLQN